MIKNVHVVIGCGPLGRATAQALKQAGCEVVLINRSGNLENPPAGVTLCALDILAHDRLPKELEDCVAIHFCAQPAYHRWVEEFPALQEADITLAAVARCAVCPLDHGEAWSAAWAFHAQRSLPHSRVRLNARRSLAEKSWLRPTVWLGRSLSA